MSVSARPWLRRVLTGLRAMGNFLLSLIFATNYPRPKRHRVWRPSPASSSWAEERAWHCQEDLSAFFFNCTILCLSSVNLSQEETVQNQNVLLKTKQNWRNPKEGKTPPWAPMAEKKSLGISNVLGQWLRRQGFGIGRSEVEEDACK